MKPPRPTQRRWFGAGRPDRPSVRHRQIRFAVVAIAAIAVIGCSKPDTFAVVQVSATETLGDVEQLVVMLMTGGQAKNLTIPAQPMMIILPTKFTVELDRSHQGRLDLSIDALDGSGAVIAFGSGSILDLKIGQQNPVSIALTPGTGPGPDAGTDDGGVDAPVDAPAEDISGSGGAPAGTGGSGSGGSGSGGSGSGGSGSGGSGTGGSGTGGSGTGGMGGVDGMGGRGGATGVGGGSAGTGGAEAGGGAGGSGAAGAGPGGAGGGEGGGGGSS